MAANPVIMPVNPSSPNMTARTAQMIVHFNMVDRMDGLPFQLPEDDSCRLGLPYS